MAYGGKGPPDPKGVYASLLPSLTRCPRSNEIPPYGSGENFLVTGLVLLSLPTVAKGFVSEDASSILCSPLSAFLVSVLLVVGARSTRVDDDRANNTIVTDMVSPVSLMEEATGTCQNREISPSDLFRLSHRAQQDQLYNGLLLQRLCSLQPVLTCE